VCYIICTNLLCIILIFMYYLNPNAFLVHRRDMNQTDIPKPLQNPKKPILCRGRDLGKFPAAGGTFGTGSYYQPVPKILSPELSWWPTWRPVLYRFVSNRYERGGALVPNNLYRLQNRYECPSGTGTHERFSTSVPVNFACPLTIT
jgi:hypothetical protein